MIKITLKKFTEWTRQMQFRKGYTCIPNKNHKKSTNNSHISYTSIHLLLTFA